MLSRVMTLTLTLWLAACGNDAGFTGESARGTEDAAGKGKGPGVQEPPPDDGDPATPPPYNSLTWFLQCVDEPVAVPVAPTVDDVVVEGEGPHELDRARIPGTPVVFQGRVCKPAELLRDIVIVIDTSGSMNDNDKLVAGSCGRLQAVQAVVASIPAGRAKFGVVTFNSTLDTFSTGMYDTGDLLYADLAKGGLLSDVLCKGTGGTNYDAGLTKAGEILSGGRPGATKEIYFVSDGQPNGGQEGIAIADSLKNVGVNVGADFISVTIATVMLAGVDTVLESQIASKDPNGKALHAFAAQTGSLTKVLTDLASNDFVSATLQYRAIGKVEWTTLDLLSHLTDFAFTLPSITIDVADAPRGLEMLFEYRDRRDNRFSSGGKLLWEEGAAGN